MMKESEALRGKIELTIGNLSFSGEGDQEWLDRQINKLIDLAPKVQTVTPVDSVSSKLGGKRNETLSNRSLASYLREKGGDTVQVQRFLATAGWLWYRGEKDLTTKAVSKALQDNQQKRLSNASDCLNQNVSRGFCEKTSVGFFITPEGLKQLGEGED